MWLLTIAIALLLLRLWLGWLNLSHLAAQGDRVPEGFEDCVDGTTLAQMNTYTIEASRVGLFRLLIGQVLVLWFLFGGGVIRYDQWIASFDLGVVGGGLLFFGGLYLVWTLVALPFKAWRTFCVESRYGFNTTSVGLWCIDTVKGLLLSMVLLGLALTGSLALIERFPDGWWFPVWICLASLTLFTVWVSPYLIEPLFFNFRSLEDDALCCSIRRLMAKTGHRIDKILQVDASRRSTHSNAYFTGVGKNRRIVLFDTLLQQMNHAEVLAILAHEVGHWHFGHIRKGLIRSLSGLFLSCLAVWWLLPQPEISAWVGVSEGSLSVRLLILGFVGAGLSFLFTPWKSFLLRRQEWQADRYAAGLIDDPAPMASALIKLSCHNLTNLHPHPWFAWFYFSHPPAVQRLQRLRQSVRATTAGAQ